MNSTIITGFEVVKYGPVDDSYPVDSVCNHIQRVEVLEFSKCYMGLEFYEELLTDVTDTSAARAFVVGSTYAKDEMVVYKGCALKSLEDGNMTSPQNDISKWVAVDKFNNPCFNNLWKNGLKNWLAFAVITTSIRYNTYKAGSKGLVKITADDTGISTVNTKEFGDYKREMINDTEQWLTIIYDYMVRITSDKDSSCSYSNIAEVSTACGDSCLPPSRRRKRRFHFKK